jgi:hypothetical protein
VIFETVDLSGAGWGVQGGVVTAQVLARGRSARGSSRFRGRGRWVLVLTALVTVALLPLSPDALAQNLTPVVNSAVIPAGSGSVPYTYSCPDSHPFLYQVHSTANGSELLPVIILLSSQQPGADPQDQTRLSGGGVYEPSTLANSVDIYPGAPGSPAWVTVFVSNPGPTAGKLTVMFVCADAGAAEPPGQVHVYSNASGVDGHATVAALMVDSDSDSDSDAPGAGDEMNVDYSVVAGVAGDVSRLQLLFCDWSGSGVDVPTVFDPVEGVWFVEKAIGASHARADWVARRFWPQPAGYPSDFWPDRLNYGSFGGDAPLPGMDDVAGCGDYTGLGHDQPLLIRGYGGSAYQQVFIAAAGFDPDPTHTDPAPLTGTVVGPWVSYQKVTDKATGRVSYSPDRFVSGDFYGRGFDTVGYERQTRNITQWSLLNRPNPFGGSGSQSWDIRNLVDPDPTTTVRQPLVGDWTGAGVDLPGVKIGSRWLLFGGWPGSKAAPTPPPPVLADFSWGDPAASPGSWHAITRPLVEAGPSRPAYYSPTQRIWALGQTEATGGVGISYGVNLPVPAGAVPMMCDWNGDGLKSPGYFDPATGTWAVWDAAYTSTTPEYTFHYALTGVPPSQQKPLCADWDGDGIDTPALVDISGPDAIWHLRNHNSAGPDEATYTFGLSTDRFLAGDWTGTGTAEPALVRADLANGHSQWILATATPKPATTTPQLTFELGPICPATGPTPCTPIAHHTVHTVQNPADPDDPTNTITERNPDTIGWATQNTWQLADTNTPTTNLTTFTYGTDKQQTPMQW